MPIKSILTMFIVVVAGVFVALVLYGEFKTLRPIDDFGVGKIHERVRIIKGDFVRASDPAKTSVAEYYVNTGKWPATNKDAALPEPNAYRGESLETLTVAENKITMSFDEKIGAGGGTIVMTATYAPDTMIIKWDCLSPNIADISTVIPYCQFSNER